MTTMTDFLWEFIHKLWAFSLVFVPTIAVYVVVAQVSLKVWIAAQNTPRLPANTDERLETPPRKGFLETLRRHSPWRSSSWIPIFDSAMLGLILLMTWAMDYFSKADEDTKRSLQYGLLFLPGTFSVARLPLRVLSVVVARTQNGAPFYVHLKEKESWIAYLFQLLISLGVTTVAIFEGPSVVLHRLCQAVLYGSFLHVLLLGSVTSSSENRSLRLQLICTGIGGVICTGIVISTMMYNEEQGSLASDAPPSDAATNLGVFRRYSVVFQGVTWYWAYISFEINSLCYKMDYKLSLESRRLTAPVVRRLPTSTSNEVSETDSDPEVEKKPVLVVQVLPSFKPVFDKTYFNATIAGFLFTTLSLALVTAALEVYGHSRIGYEWVPYFLSGMAAPVICAFVMARAYRRGEFRKVWGYGERWMDIPDDIPLLPQSEIEEIESTPGLEFHEKEKIPEINEKEQFM